jgi:hypothetical protein
VNVEILYNAMQLKMSFTMDGIQKVRDNDFRFDRERQNEIMPFACNFLPILVYNM